MWAKRVTVTPASSSTALTVFLLSWTDGCSSKTLSLKKPFRRPALPKIVEGRVTGFYKDVVLLEQPSVSDNKKTVKALLDEAGVTVTRFVRFEVGQP